MISWKNNNYPFLFVVLIFNYHVSNAQFDSLFLKAREKFITDSIKICKAKKVRPQLGLDNRNSFLRISPVDIKGFYGGILFRDRYKFSLGYYQVDANSHGTKTIINKQVKTLRELDLYYTTFNFEYFPIHKRYIKLGIPIDLGYGFSSLKIYNETKSNLIYSSSGDFTPFSLGIDLILKPVKWVGIKGEVGYRKILRKSEKRIDFDGFYYSYGLAFDIREIIKSVRLLYAKKTFKKALK